MADNQATEEKVRLLVPRRVFGRLVSQGERMKLQPDENLGGCWMIRREYVDKLLAGKLSEIYFTWVPDSPDWKSRN